jgi:hypothetical protein
MHHSLSHPNLFTFTGVVYSVTSVLGAAATIFMAFNVGDMAFSNGTKELDDHYSATLVRVCVCVNMHQSSLPLHTHAHISVHTHIYTLLLTPHPLFQLSVFAAACAVGLMSIYDVVRVYKDVHCNKKAKGQSLFSWDWEVRVACVWVVWTVAGLILYF